MVAKNLNKIIDQNYYPVPEAKRSNMRHRPIGIGVQGLADAFMLMRYDFFIFLELEKVLYIYKLFGRVKVVEYPASQAPVKADW